MLTDTWRDLVSIFGLITTVAGLAYAIWQIHLTKSAADAARDAADLAAHEMRQNFLRYAAFIGHRLIHEAMMHVEHSLWHLAAMRLNDLSEQTAQIARLVPDENGTWKSLTEELRSWGITMSRIAADKIGIQPKKWSDFTIRVRQELDQHHGPFLSSGQEQS